MKALTELHLEKSVSFKPYLLLLSCHSSNLPLSLLQKLETAELSKRKKKNCSNVESRSFVVVVWVVYENPGLIVLLLVST